MINPSWMRRVELCGRWCDPLGQALIVVLGWRYLPAHDEKHDIEDGNPLG